jgi:antitoxin (DNA-binding transcriptional repressor) of toxin-antitoxin stability system
MEVYTYSEARRNLATLLDRALQQGGVLITRRDGQVFVVRPQRPKGSPLDVPGLDLGLSANEIASAIREGRRLYEPEQEEASSSPQRSDQI